MKSQGITEVTGIHPLGTMNVAQNSVSISLVNVEIFQSGSKWWTNRPTLPSLLSHVACKATKLSKYFKYSIQQICRARRSFCNSIIHKIFISSPILCIELVGLLLLDFWTGNLGTTINIQSLKRHILQHPVLMSLSICFLVDDLKLLNMQSSNIFHYFITISIGCIPNGGVLINNINCFDRNSTTSTIAHTVHWNR